MDILIVNSTGLIAAALTTVSFIPQVVKAHRSKRTKDLSLAMFILLSIGLVLWLIYGVYLNLVPVIIANSVTLSMSLYLLFLKVKHG